jgi:heptosyltransferase-2
MKKVLVIQTAFLGDVVLATAFIRQVNELFTHSKIDVLVKKGNESLLANHPLINEVFCLDKQFGKFREISRLTKEFRTNNYDIVFNLQRFGSSGLLTILSGAKQKIGFKKNPFSMFFTKRVEHTIGDGTHEVVRNSKLLQTFGAVSPVPPELFPSDEDFGNIKKYQSSYYYCLAPASVWFTKQLQEEKWVELISKFDAEKAVYLLGAPNDSELCERILKASNTFNVFNLAGKLSLLESAALIKGAKRTYVNDSAPLHICSAMNAPVTAFFCSTIPDFGFGPLSDDKEILQVENLECKPCGIHGYRQCPKGHFKCAEIELNVKL